MIVRELAYLNATGAMDPADFAFAYEAVRIQLHRDFLPAWARRLPPNRRPVEVTGYTSSRDLVPGTFAPIEVLASLDTPGVQGDHSGAEATDSAWGRSLPDSIVMSHEGLETAGDTFADRWMILPSGMVTALEVCDAVEEDSYPITVSIGAATRDVWVSNFVYPAWFDGLTDGPFDYMGRCRGPGDNRGYIIVEQPDGSTINVFADGATDAYKAKVEAKLARRSRTASRHSQIARVMVDPRIDGHW